MELCRRPSTGPSTLSFEDGKPKVNPDSYISRAKRRTFHVPCQALGPFRAYFAVNPTKTTPPLRSASQPETNFSPPYDFTIAGEHDSQSVDPELISLSSLNLMQRHHPRQRMETENQRMSAHVPPLLLQNWLRGSWRCQIST